MTEHPAVEALRRCRFDLTAAQARLTDALNALNASSFKTPEAAPVAAILREIENGAIRDDVDLRSAVQAVTDANSGVPRLTVHDITALRSMLPGSATSSGPQAAATETALAPDRPEVNA